MALYEWIDKMTDIFRLEGFSSPLKGQRIWLYGTRDTLASQIIDCLGIVEEEVLNRGRKVLIVQGAREVPLRGIQWDATFRVKETQDLRLAVTYIQNAVKPVRVVWLGDEPPSTVLNVVQEATFIVGSTALPRGSWSAIFWHPSASQAQIEEGLSPRMGVQKLNLPSVLRELNASGVGLVWSLIKESEKSGSIYWYDLSESKEHVKRFDPLEAIETLKEVSQYLQKTL